jgi:hypothetical protein
MTSSSWGPTVGSSVVELLRPVRTTIPALVMMAVGSFFLFVGGWKGGSVLSESRTMMVWRSEGPDGEVKSGRRTVDSS